MIPDSPILVVIFTVLYAFLYALIGMVVGGCVGWLMSLLIGCRRQQIFIAACFGSVGYVAGFIGTSLMPWHQNTISYRLSGGGVVTSTMNTYQHPGWIAIVLAIIFPLIYALSRYKRVG